MIMILESIHTELCNKLYGIISTYVLQRRVYAEPFFPVVETN